MKESLKRWDCPVKGRAFQAFFYVINKNDYTESLISCTVNIQSINRKGVYV